MPFDLTEKDMALGKALTVATVHIKPSVEAEVLDLLFELSGEGSGNIDVTEPPTDDGRN